MTDFDIERLTDSFLDASRMRGDPEADARIERLSARIGADGVLAFFERLIGEVEMPVEELPPELRDFVVEFRVPSWTDPERVARAEAVFRRHGPRYLLLLYFMSLPTLYACARGARVLTVTGRLAHQGDEMEIFARRIAETGQFLIHVLEPGGLLTRHGLATTLKVRLIHAAIRIFATRDGREFEGEVPINQEDLGVTLQTFSSTVIRGLALTGIELDAADRDAVMHHWKVVGHCLGMDQAFLPDRFEEGVLLERRILDRQAAPSEAGQLLTRALLKFGRDRLPFRFRNAPQLLIAYLVDARVEQSIHVEDRLPWYIRLLPRVLTRVFRLASRLTDYDPAVARTVDRLAALMTRAMVESFNRHKGTPFYVPATLKQAWIDRG